MTKTENYNEQQYLSLLQELIDISEKESINKDRTGVGTYKKFGHIMTFDLTNNKVPLLTTKKIFYKSALRELIWMFVLGNPDTSYLEEHGVKIWDEWKVPLINTNTHTIGEMYGQVLRNFKYDMSQDGVYKNIDQIQDAIQLLKNHPHTRRAVFSAFDPRTVAKEDLSFKENVDDGRGVLNNCHSAFNQINITNDGQLEFLTLVRANDIYIGCPFNCFIASVLAHMFAQVLGLKASRLIYMIGDAHLYSNHIEQAKLQLTRIPYQCPTIKINPDIKDWDDFKFEDFEIVGYEHHSHIKAPIAV